MLAPIAPGHLPLLGNLYSMRTAPLATLTRALRENGDISRVEFPGGLRGHFLFHTHWCRTRRRLLGRYAPSSTSRLPA